MCSVRSLQQWTSFSPFCSLTIVICVLKTSKYIFIIFALNSYLLKRLKRYEEKGPWFTVSAALIPLCRSQFPPGITLTFLGVQVCWCRILSVSVCLTKVCSPLILKDIFAGYGTWGFITLNMLPPVLWSTWFLTRSLLSFLPFLSASCCLSPLVASKNFPLSVVFRHLIVMCLYLLGSVGLWLTSNLNILGHHFFKIFLCLPPPLLLGLQ